MKRYAESIAILAAGQIIAWGCFVLSTLHLPSDGLAILWGVFTTNSATINAEIAIDS